MKRVKEAARLIAINRAIAILVIIIVVMPLIAPRFYARTNIENLLFLGTLTGIISVAMAFALVGGQFDLSVGATLGLGGYAAAWASNSGPIFALGVALLVGLVCGLLNGVVVAVLRVNAFIATLGTTSLITGFTLLISNQQSLAATDADFLRLGSTAIGPIPIVAIGLVVIAGLGWWVLQNTSVGVTLRALGASPSFCEDNAVRIKMYRVGMFVALGVMAGLSGALTTALVGGADPNAGISTPLLVISACILGGVSLNGGEGTVGQAIAGTFVLAALVNGMNLLGVTPYFQTVFRVS